MKNERLLTLFLLLGVALTGIGTTAAFAQFFDEDEEVFTPYPTKEGKNEPVFKPDTQTGKTETPPPKTPEKPVEKEETEPKEPETEPTAGAETEEAGTTTVNQGTDSVAKPGETDEEQGPPDMEPEEPETAETGPPPQSQEAITKEIEAVPAFKESFEEKPTGASVTYELFDSDRDGVNDSEEKKIGTDPLLWDTDRDGIPDSLDSKPAEEIVPEVKKLSQKQKQIRFRKAIREEAKKQYNVVAQAVTDADRDGCSDEVEILRRTDPTRKDSDGDGFLDCEEISDFNSNPLDPKSPGKFIFMLAIANMKSGDRVSNKGFTLSGVAPKNSHVEVDAISSVGDIIMLGETTATENNKFIFTNTLPLPSGPYLVFTRLLPNQQKTSRGSYVALAASELYSQTILLDVKDEEGLPTPEPKTLGGQEIPAEVLLRNLSITVKDKKPILTGSAFPGTQVTGTWQSALFSAALLADLEGGPFEIVSPQEFEQGNHEVVIYATRPEDGTQSRPVKLAFTVTPQETKIPEEGERPVGPEEPSPVSPIVPIALFFTASILIILGIGVYYKKKKTPPKSPPTS